MDLLDFVKAKNQVLALIKKASEAETGVEAIHWSQAACNASNALLGVINAEKERESR